MMFIPIFGMRDRDKRTVRQVARSSHLPSMSNDEPDLSQYEWQELSYTNLCPQFLHFQEAKDRKPNWASNPGTPVWDPGTTIAVVTKL